MCDRWGHHILSDFSIITGLPLKNFDSIASASHAYR